jgi:hypothetical protein
MFTAGNSASVKDHPLRGAGFFYALQLPNIKNKPVHLQVYFYTSFRFCELSINIGQCFQY